MKKTTSVSTSVQKRVSKIVAKAESDKVPIYECPACGSKKVVHHAPSFIPEMQAFRVWADCEKCKTRWREIFSLTMISPMHIYGKKVEA